MIIRFYTISVISSSTTGNLVFGYIKIGRLLLVELEIGYWKLVLEIVQITIDY